MYSKRPRRDSSEEPHSGESDSEFSTRSEQEPVYKPNPVQIRKRVAGSAYGPLQMGYRTKVVTSQRREDGYEQFVYEQNDKKLIPKVVKWQLMSDDVRKQVRKILSDDYRKTLMNIGGSDTRAGLSQEVLQVGSELLKPIATQIDRRLRLMLLPDEISKHLLDPEVPAKTNDLYQRLEHETQVAAEFDIQISHKEVLLEETRMELRDLVEKLNMAREKRLKQITDEKREYPDDYVQMLMIHPSSK